MYLLLLSMIVVILVILAFLYHKWTFWKRQGIPNDLSSKSGLPFHVTDNESHRKYGKIVGYYEGLKPCLSITDPNLIRKVLVTEFHTFANHRELADEDELISNGLFLSRYPNWKRIRAIQSPSFSTGKLKAMKPMIEKTMDQLIAKLDPKASDQQIVDFRQYYDSFTFDVITRAAAGVHTDAIDNPSNNPFLMAVKKTFQRDQNIWNWIVLFMPFMRNFVKIKFFDGKSQEIIAESIRRVIRERTEKNIDVPDLLQYSMDYSVLSAKVIRSKEFANFEKLTENEVLGQSINMIAAGYESTGTQLCFITRLLALNPDHQNRLVDEIKTTFDDNSDIDYDRLMKMPFLDAFVKEVMRINCSLNRIDRIVTNDTYLGRIFLPKGTVIIIPIWALHVDPDHFPDPMEFKPDRFMPNNEHLIKDYTYLPFATGPRNCIGMRFALMEMKYSLVRLLRKYEFLACDETQNLDYFAPLIQVASMKQMKVRVKHR